MALDDVLSALGNHKELAEEVKSIYEANGGNVERIGVLESELNEAIAKKSKVLDLVRKNLGVSEVSEETLSQFAQGGDEAIRKDNEALQEKLAEMQGKLAETEQTYNKKIDTMVLKDTLRGLGVSKRTANEVAFEELTNLILNEAQRDGANFVFKDEEGRTKFTESGKPMTVEDRIAELSRGDRSYLFKEPVGGGAPSASSPTSTQTTAPASNGLAAYVTENYLS